MKNQTTLDPKFKKDWVKALLSGKYTQNNSIGRNGSNHHCVLGVGGIALNQDAPSGYNIFKDKKIQEDFIRLNDMDKVPFEIFAGIIDEWL